VTTYLYIRFACIAFSVIMLSISALVTRRVRAIQKRTRERMNKCGGALDPGCACGGCPSNAFCSCKLCTDYYAANLLPGGPVAQGGGGSTTVHHVGGGAGGGGGGGSGLVQWTPAPGVSGGVSGGGIVATNKQPTGSGSGMTGFAEQGRKELDFAFGTVSGLRQWTLDGPDFSLDPAGAEASWARSAIYGATGYAWSAGVLEGVCNNGKNHLVPCEQDEAGRCGCGFWAYWDMAGLSGNRFSPSGVRRLPVLGVIAGFGRVILGERGFRSQKARLIALAPAFTIQAEVSAAWAEGQNEAQQAIQVRAQAHADAWMAVIQDRLQTMYPECRVFATTAGLLASVKCEGRPG